jgi:transcriptional regulator with XRE-family HTH domain
MTDQAERQRELGRLLKQIRSTYGEGLRPFGARIGLSPSYLGKVENGLVPVPRRATIETIAERLNIDDTKLLTAAGYVPHHATSTGADAELDIILSQLDPEQRAAVVAAAKWIRDQGIRKTAAS